MRVFIVVSVLIAVAVGHIAVVAPDPRRNGLRANGQCGGSQWGEGAIHTVKPGQTIELAWEVGGGHNANNAQNIVSFQRCDTADGDDPLDVAAVPLNCGNGDAINAVNNQVYTKPNPNGSPGQETYTFTVPLDASLLNQKAVLQAYWDGNGRFGGCVDMVVEANECIGSCNEAAIDGTTANACDGLTGTCVCDPLFEGTNCELRTCLTACVNGACDTTTGTCTCQDGFTGEACDVGPKGRVNSEGQRIDENGEVIPPGPSAGATAFIVIGVIVAVAIVAALLNIFLKKRRQAAAAGGGNFGSAYSFNTNQQFGNSSSYGYGYGQQSTYSGYSGY